MRVVDAQIHLWGSGLPRNMARRQVTAFTSEEAVGVTMSTEELPWLPERDKHLVMGQAVCAWWGWS